MGEGVGIMQAALDLAARGFRVFPLVPGRRRPAFEGWQAAASTDPERIRQWWSEDAMVVGFTKAGDEVVSTPRFNVGVACGGGLLGVDIDVKQGKEGLESAAALGIGMDGFVVRTPSGGRHVYMRGPDVRSSVGLLEGLDIRSLNAFVVGPGSVVDGVAYEIVSDADLRAAPTALLEKCFGLLDKRNDAPVVTPDRPDAVDRALDYLAHAPLATEGAAGDVTTFKVAAYLKDFGVGEDMAVDLMAEHWNDRCSPPWDIEDLKTKVRNAYEYGARPLGDLHPMADFAGVKAPEKTPRPARGWFHHGDARGKVDWLFYKTLPKVGVALLQAESQAGKTFLLLELARALATGKPFFKEAPDDKGATLFLFAGSEGSGFALRLDALGETERLPIAATQVANLADRDALPQLLEDLRAEAAWMEAEFGLPVRMIVLETLSASGLVTDENDNSEAARALANVASIARTLGALVVTSHHPKKDGRGHRGAGAFRDNVDYVLEIQREGDIRELILDKARDGEQRKLGTFTLLPVDLGQDERGRPVTSMTVSTGEVMSNVVRAAPHADKLMEALEWAIMESGEDVGGRPGCEESLVRDMFKERVGTRSMKDRSNLLKAFKAAKAWCQQLGRLDVVAVGAETFLVPKQFEAAV